MWVDATLIVQVFVNLFDNIAKYTPPSTHVTVSAVPGGDGESLRVSVEDDGPGLPPGLVEPSGSLHGTSARKPMQTRGWATVVV